MRLEQGARVLIISSKIGHGHHASALALQHELARAAPDARVVVRDGLAGSRLARTLLERGLRRQLLRFPSSYTLTFALLRSAALRRLAARLLSRTTASGLAALIAAERPDVVVSTYPAITTTLGAMRAGGELALPLCALITDVAGLHFWAHPSVDLHIACYGESLPEIARVSRGAPACHAAPPVAPSHLHGRSRHACRTALGLAPERPLVVVSGGGWGVGDLAGATAVALACSSAQVAIVCGHNEALRRRLATEYADQTRVAVLGFTDAMAELLGAASVLVHSTGGVTCLEAAVHGCPVIAYGFDGGHMRQNLRTMRRIGVLSHAANRSQLRRELLATLASPPSVRERASLPSASSLVIGLIDGRAASPGARGDAGTSGDAGTPGDADARGGADARGEVALEPVA